MKNLGDKEKLIDHCKSLLEGRLEVLDTELDKLQEASGEETKSSAGDKYETAREMITLEKNKVLSQKSTLLGQLKNLQSIRLNLRQTVEAGTILQANNQWYFISVALGPIKFNDLQFFIISPVAPIAQAMLGKALNDEFRFNNRSFKIEALL